MIGLLCLLLLPLSLFLFPVRNSPRGLSLRYETCLGASPASPAGTWKIKFCHKSWTAIDGISS